MLEIEVAKLNKEIKVKLKDINEKGKCINERVELLILNPRLTSQASIAPVVLYIGLILLKL
jgi:hypothetical protein